jgi:hypothetical protein
MPAEDLFSRFRQDNFSPITHAVAVTPDDEDELEYVTRALYVGDGGDLVVVLQDSGTVTFVGVPTGTTLPIRVKKVLATGTLADAIVALW